MRLWVGECSIWLRVKACGAGEGFWVGEGSVWLRIKTCVAYLNFLLG
jgi:hypothetical protein